MPIKVFYSWQSDQPKNRSFVRSALSAAIKELREDLSLDEAQRDIAMDQDTQDIPGSPGVADAILAKIRMADVFLADLTFIQNDAERAIATRPCPNPNVMLEYGYALHALGDGKIIGVFNEAHGSPKDLPFDLNHRRWPIRFTLVDRDALDKEKEKKALKDALKNAIRSIISRFDEQQTPSTTKEPFEAAAPGDGVGRLRHHQDYLCLTSSQTKPIWLKEGPYSFLRFIPTTATKLLGEVEAYRIAQANLQPIGRHAKRRMEHRATHDRGCRVLDCS